MFKILILQRYYNLGDEQTEYQIQDKDNDLWIDSAYTGEGQEKTIEKYQMKNHVHEKASRNKPLTQEQKDSNREKSRTRARVEHVFGFMEVSMNRFCLNCVGLKRVTTIVGLINLTYNLFRYEQIVRLHGITMSNFQQTKSLIY